MKNLPLWPGEGKFSGISALSHQYTTCELCGHPFNDPKHRDRRFCSLHCSALAQSGAGVIPCEICGKPFRRENRAQKYCSKACYGVSRQTCPQPIRLTQCAMCGKPVSSTGTKYCSRACYAQSKRHPLESRIKTCETCGKLFEINAYHRRTRFCSQECTNVGLTSLPVLTKTCMLCGKEFETKKATRKYCSPDCKQEHQRVRWATLTPQERALEVDRLQGAMEFISGIEKRLQSVLNGWQVEYVSQYRIHHYWADLYVPNWNFVIEAFGCYWHSCQQCGLGDRDVREYDERRRADIVGWGYQVAIIWEHDIKRDAEEALLVAFRSVSQQME